MFHGNGKQKEQAEAFEEIKRVISKETLLAFPRFDKAFHAYTDASNYQLGTVIMQEGRPLAFYSRKLNGAQKNYTTGEQELLSIVESNPEVVQEHSTWATGYSSPHQS
jgi:RNase H-like domain found in reverse transcriptase